MLFPVPIWMMTEEELLEAREILRDLDQALLLQLFGAEGARRYRWLLKREERATDDVAAREAGEEREQMEAALDEPGRRLLFGTGEKGVVDPDEIRWFLEEVTSFDPESPKALGQSLKFSFMRLGESRDFGSMGWDQLRAYTGVRAGLLYAQGQGWDARAVLVAAARAINGLYTDSDDGRFMSGPLAREISRDGGASYVAWATAPPPPGFGFRLSSPFAGERAGVLSAV
ncbi:MAG: hypothetical protein ACJ74Q_15445 [Pyrinomonadaceae bacterium]